MQRDLAERGLIKLRGVGKVEPTAPAPEFAIPRLAKKQTRAASKPQSGVFAASADLAWTGLPTAEFRANLRHIAEKRVRKGEQAFLDERGLPPSVGGDLSTPEKVEAHIAEVLASPTFAQVRWRDGQPYSIAIVRLGAEGVDQLVGVSLHKNDGTGRMHIATAYNARREDTIRRLAAALDKNGPEAVKWQKAPDQLNEILQLVVQVPQADRGPSWAQFKASLIREQAALGPGTRQAARVIPMGDVQIDPSDAGMRLLAEQVVQAGGTVYVAPNVRNMANRAVADVLDIVPARYRVGALEKIEPIGERIAGDDDPTVRATFRTPDGKKFTLDGYLSEFTDAGALHDADDEVITLNIFGARSLLAGHNPARDLVEGRGRQLRGDARPTLPDGVSFALSMRRRVFHEVLHARWRDLDALSQARLVAHANRLGVLDKTFVEFDALAHFEPKKFTGDPTDAVTIRDAYERLGATTDIFNQEAVAHMVQLAAVGGLKAEDLAPVREILERLFDGDQRHMTRVLDGEPAPRRLNALEAPRRQDPHLAEIEQRRVEHVAHQMRVAEALERWWLKETAFMREGDGQPRNPAIETLARARETRQLIEILEACRS